MSSTNDTYHHQLLVQTQLKSILKKSSSPKFVDSSMDSENNLHVNPEKDDIDMNEISNYNNNNNNHVCILNDNPSGRKDNSYLSSIEIPLTKLLMASYENDGQSIQAADSSSPSSSSLTSDDEQQQQQQQQRRVKLRSKKKCYRPFVTTSTLSSSSDNDEKKTANRSMEESKTTLIRSNKHCPKDMQLNEFMRKYQQQGGILLPTKDDPDNEQITTQVPINHHQQESPTKQVISHISKETMNDDTMSLLESIDTITLSSTSLSPLQLLFNVASGKQCDRRIKIERIRQYVEEQVGISAFLTMYKLIKSSQISIDLRQKSFCYYANLIPHLCCLIMLESEEQKNRF